MSEAEEVREEPLRVNHAWVQDNVTKPGLQVQRFPDGSTTEHGEVVSDQGPKEEPVADEPDSDEPQGVLIEPKGRK